MTKIRAIIFDMDGVLIDAKDWHYEALNRALGLFGYSISRYDHLITYDGLPTKRKLEMLSHERNLPSGLHGFIGELKQIYTMEIVTAKCKPVFQHEYALSNLHAMGYRLAVASNSIRSSVDVMMTKSNLLPYLDFFLSNEDVTNAKPHPDIYQLAIKRLDCTPEECLVIEDNEHGIRAARAANTNVMSVNSPSDVTLDNILASIRAYEEMS